MEREEHVRARNTPFLAIELDEHRATAIRAPHSKYSSLPSNVV